jgi:restriction system protein
MSYRDLKSYQQATIVYDFTVEFCNKYMSYKTNKSYRTYDQMVQAARSGKQNIVEGSSQKTSEKSELKLFGVSRASFQELLEDFEDFLRQRGLKQWDKNDPRAIEIRNLSYKSTKTYKTYQSYLNNPESAANCAICLINQVNYLLDRQIKSLENQFIETGGYTEKFRQQRENENKKRLIKNLWRKYE